jgi:hypothetical protein
MACVGMSDRRVWSPHSGSGHGAWALLPDGESPHGCREPGEEPCKGDRQGQDSREGAETLLLQIGKDNLVQRL